MDSKVRTYIKSPSIHSESLLFVISVLKFEQREDDDSAEMILIDKASSACAGNVTQERMLACEGEFVSSLFMTSNPGWITAAAG
jgi:hypothetical protein